MKYIVSRYNQEVEWLKEYTDDVVIYDRSENRLSNSISMPNIGSDLYDKFTYIIDNYDNLPDIAVYTKANLFKYITKEEFDKVKDTTTFTPLLTAHHKEVFCDEGLCKQLGVESKIFSFYNEEMYFELNYPAFLKSHPTQDPRWCYIDTYYDFPLLKLLEIDKLGYTPFAPGSNYILPKENILKYPKSFYEKLRSYLEWDRYPGEAMIIERGLYTIWN